MQMLGTKNLLDEPDFYPYRDLSETNKIFAKANTILDEAKNLGIENITNYVCELASKQNWYQGHFEFTMIYVKYRQGLISKNEKKREQSAFWKNYNDDKMMS